MSDWISLRKRKPKLGSRILVCDEFGYVTIEEACLYGNKTWLESWKVGNSVMVQGWLLGCHCQITHKAYAERMLTGKCRSKLAPIVIEI